MNDLRKQSLLGCLLGILAFGLIGAGVTTYTGCAPVYGDSPATQIASDIVTVQPGIDGVTRRAVVFGPDHVNPSNYSGWNGECPGTILDALRMRALMTRRGYAAVLLTNEQATAFRITSACVAAGVGLKAGDKLVIYGSSHGGQAADYDGDEGPGGMDSTICLWDGQFVDDLVGKLLSRVPAGVEVAIIFDMCNTGTMYKGLPHNYTRVFKARGGGVWDIKCSGVYMGGCGDGKSSYGGDDGGVFSGRLISSGPEDLSWIGWFDAAAAKMPRNQTPVFVTFGPDIRNKGALQ